MEFISVPEYGTIKRERLGALRQSRLQSFDEAQALASGSAIFDWSPLRYIRALNHVGVVSVPGLTVEILPKIDETVNDGPAGRHGSDSSNLARGNLLYMLAVAGWLPAKEGALAQLRLRRLPLLEAFTLVFAEHLLRELNKGLHKAYLRREENARFLRGKMLVNQHVRLNAVRKDRVFVAFDEFAADNWLNRVFKGTCHMLLPMVQLQRTRSRLREALLHLADVSRVTLAPHHFGKVELDRNTERFRGLVEFCRLVVSGTAVLPYAGRQAAFSLLFPMDRLFERFVARFVARHASSLGLGGCRVCIQAKTRRLYLLRRGDGRGAWQLRPDIFVESQDRQRRIVVDTKWKHLGMGGIPAGKGISRDDIYQLYSYVTRYDASDGILLYPRTHNAKGHAYTLAADARKAIRVEFLDLGHDLFKDRTPLVSGLARAFRPLAAYSRSNYAFSDSGMRSSLE